MQAMPLVPRVLVETDHLRGLRHSVRAWLSQRIAAGAFTPGVDRWLNGYDRDFTRTLAEQGWLGMTIPEQYGGRGRTFVERFIVTEELLAVGAPVAAAWIADRQIAPTLLRYGTEDQKQKYLPAIAEGRCFFAIGMSEPDSGSDLASVRTRATRTDGGWTLTGTKVWTSGAHLSDAFFALARTTPTDPGDRHAGLSQFIVDLRSEGVQIRPILSLNGSHHFNEVHLNEVFVPDDMVLGRIGSGWQQVTSELAFERSGPERFLSSFLLYAALVDLVRSDAAVGEVELGRTLARLRGLHQMSMAVAGALERGEMPDAAASIVKVLGTSFEGDIAEVAALGTDVGGTGATSGPHDSSERFEALLETALMHRPGFTLRGGTNEILRGVIARGLGLR